MAAQIPDEKRSGVNRKLRLGRYEGPLLIDASLPEEHQAMVKERRAYAARVIDGITAKDTVRPNIYFDFVEDSRFNAVATLLENDYFILVNTAVLVDIAAVFRNLFSLPQFASHIGDSSLERELRVQSVKINGGVARVTEIMPYPERLPACPARTLIAAVFSQTALDFLLHHEIAHIRNGHLPFLFPRKPAQLAEADASSKDLENVVGRHTLEMDADASAIVNGVNDVLDLMGSTWSAEDRKPLEKIYSNIESCLYSFLLPAYVLFRCFGNRSWSPETIWMSTHPPPAMRQFHLPGIVDAHLSRLRRHLIAANRIYEIAIDVIEEVESGLSLLTGVIPDMTGFSSASRYWPIYGKQLNEYWNQAFQNLDKLKLGGQLAPPEPWREFG